jgi:predicted butyrate kinase (DUF1464 family)
VIRAAGSDPGTSSLDLLVLEHGAVAAQGRFTPEELKADRSAAVRWLEERGPFDLVSGPSGYGLPLVRKEECTERDLALLSLVRPDERGTARGVAGFTSLVRTFRESSLPVVFLPGVIHLPTVPSHRKLNRIDLGTPDKLCVAALALKKSRVPFLLVEMGSAFTACLVLKDGQVVDGLGGTAGPIGLASGGAWDGEMAYLLSPLAKADLFAGGVASVPDRAEGRTAFREGLVRTAAGLRAVTPFDQIVLSGRALETEPQLVEAVVADLSRFAVVHRLESLPGAWVKHAAQGAALIADGLAGGANANLVQQLRLRDASGTVLDWLRHPRADAIRAAFLRM